MTRWKSIISRLFLLDHSTSGPDSNYHKIFLAIALPIGLCYVFLSPAFNVPDEHTHFFRIYHLSQCGIIAEKVGNVTGAALPRSLPTTTFIYTIGIFERNNGKISDKVIKATFEIPLQPEDTVFVAFSNTALYSPVPYIPQIAAVFIGRTVLAPPMILLYMGRMANFLVAVFLIALAIRILPFFKPLFFIVVLTPTSMYQLASLSADGITISVIVLFIALVMKATYDSDSQIRISHVTLLAMFAAIISVSKSAYVLLPALVLAIPAVRFGLHGRMQKIIIIAAGGVAFGLWAYLVRDIYSPAYAFKQIDPDAATAFILEDPWRYILILAYSMATDVWSYVETSIGIQDWDLLVLPNWTIIAYAIAILCAAFAPIRSDITIPLWHKVFFLGLATVSLVFILTVVYVTWSRPGMHKIVGMQGRYLVPLLPLFLLPLSNVVKVPESAMKYVRFVIPTATAAALVAALVLNSFKFYVE